MFVDHALMSASAPYPDDDAGIGRRCVLYRRVRKGGSGYATDVRIGPGHGGGGVSLPVLFVGPAADAARHPLYDRLVMQAATSEGCRPLATKTAAAGDMAESCERRSSAIAWERSLLYPASTCTKARAAGTSGSKATSAPDVVRVTIANEAPSAAAAGCWRRFARHRERQRQPRSAGDGGGVCAAVVGARPMRAATRRDGSGRGRHDARCVPRRRGA